MFLDDAVAATESVKRLTAAQCPTNAEAKRQAVYFTDKARLSCSFGFEDLMVAVTL